MAEGSVRVYLVEDEDDIMDLELFAVRKACPDSIVAHANDGAAAIAAIPDFGPDLVITDLRLPGMDGAAMCRAIRANPTLAKVKVMVVTGLISEEVRQELLSAGVDGFMTKPFTVSQFVEGIRALANGSPKEGEAR